MMISPKYDYIMKELFRNQTILKYFISDILRMPVSEIRTVRLTGTFLRRLGASYPGIKEADDRAEAGR